MGGGMMSLSMLVLAVPIVVALAALYYLVTWWSGQDDER